MRIFSIWRLEPIASSVCIEHDARAVDDKAGVDRGGFEILFFPIRNNKQVSWSNALVGVYTAWTDCGGLYVTSFILEPSERVSVTPVGFFDWMRLTKYIQVVN